MFRNKVSVALGGPLRLHGALGFSKVFVIFAIDFRVPWVFWGSFKGIYRVLKDSFKWIYGA